MLRLQQELFHLSPDAFARQIRKVDLATEFARLGLNPEFESRGKLCGAQDAQTVFRKSLGRDGAQNLLLDVLAALKRIDDVSSQRVLQDRVDREIAPAHAVLDGHRRIAFDEERAMSAPSLVLAPWQSHIQISPKLVDGECFADHVNVAELIE